MGQGMAVCSLGATQTVLHHCLGPAVPLWGPDLVGGACLGSGTLLPSGHGAENLRGPSWSLTHNSLVSVIRTQGPPLSFDPKVLASSSQCLLWLGGGCGYGHELGAAY